MMICSKGWFQIAYTRDLTKSINSIDINNKKLIVLNLDDKWIVYDAWCPHRGAHLGHSGCLENGAIKCQFHGLSIPLKGDLDSKKKLQVKQYLSLELGGLLFVLIDDRLDCGFTQKAQTLIRETTLVPGFEIEVEAPNTLIIENAFDSEHFHSVHKIVNHPTFDICPSVDGEYAVKGTFVIPKSRWHVDAVNDMNQEVIFCANAYSPSLVITLMDGSNPYWVITSATPINERSSRVFLSVAVPKNSSKPVNPELCKYLILKSYQGLQDDIDIWQNMNTDHIPIYLERDKSVKGFREFTSRFQ